MRLIFALGPLLALAPGVIAQSNGRRRVSETIRVPSQDERANMADIAAIAKDSFRLVEVEDIGLAAGNSKSSLRLRPMQNFSKDCKITDKKTGRSQPCRNGKRTMLVSQEDETNFSVISTNEETGESRGFMSGEEGVFAIRQERGKTTSVTRPTKTFDPPTWSCEYENVDENRRLLEGATEGRNLRDSYNPFHNHDHDHDHDIHHSHVHHDHHDVIKALKTEGVNLRGASPEDNPGRRLVYYTDDFPKTYSYKVDIYLEIDQRLVDQTGGTLQSALDYIDDLTAGGNLIYEKEIDTHLEIIGVDLVDRYDSSVNTIGALNLLVNARRNGGSDGGWPEGADLVHALLAARLGGGVAYLSAVCNQFIGFGVSANIVNEYDVDNNPEQMVWDIVVFTHELGHNFGTRHTHDIRGFDPLVDQCGVEPRCSVEMSDEDDEATIMSYCHLCEGRSEFIYKADVAPVHLNP